MVPIDHFDTAVSLTPDAIAIVEGDVALTFADVHRMSRQIARRILALAASSEPVPVVLYSPNDHRVLVTMIGVMRAGGVIVPVHAGNPIDTTGEFLRPLSPACIVYHSTLAAQVRQLRESLPSVQLCMCLDRPVGDDASFDEWASGDEPFVETWIDTNGNRDRPVYYWATSGTTGDPKIVVDDVVTFDGAMMTIRSLQVAKSSRHVSLAIAPLSHGCGPHSFAMLTLGGTVVVLQGFDPRRVLSIIERYRVTDMWLPPTALYLLLDTPGIRSRDFSSLRHVQLSTAAVAPARFKEAIEVFGPCMAQTYGQIESGFVTTLEPAVAAAAAAGDHPERLHSAGRSVFANRLAIMDDDTNLVGPCETGEIVVRGRCVKPYLDRAATDAVRVGGWHHTGDLGYLDADGYLYIVGRLKDVVNMAGIKISASELERVIMEVAGIRECAVVAIPDPIRGEVPKAIVSIRQGGAVTGEQIVAHCRNRVGAARAPTSVEEWPDLPKSPAGKIDKQRIRTMVLS